MKRPPVLHPVLFAVFPILSLFAHNRHQVGFAETHWPLALAATGTALILLVLRVGVGDWRRAGILASLVVLMVVAFGPVFDMLQDWTHVDRATFARPGYLCAWILPWSTVLVAVGRRCRRFDEWTRMLNVVSGAGVLMLAGAIALGSARHPRDVPYGELTLVASHRREPPPDIYYVIFDRYASATALREAYGFDNSPFTRFLTDRGFYVAEESRSNYLKTAHSLASALNLEFINHLAERVGRDSDDWLPLYALLQDYRAWRFLKAQGYEFVHVGSWWQPTVRNANADLNVNLSTLPEFTSVWYQTTLLYPLGVHLGGYDPRREQWRRIRYELDQLAGLPARPRPKFVFAHLLIPHDPFVFDSDGSFVSSETAAARGETVNYLNQLRFTNARLTELIDRLLQGSRTPPVIILQGDEGPFPKRYEDDEAGFDWTTATREELRLKTGILNAYYLPGADRSALYPSISPVNSLRLVFNLYFGTNLPLLPDRTFAFVNGERIYDLFDVTDRMR